MNYQRSMKIGFLFVLRIFVTYALISQTKRIPSNKDDERRITYSLVEQSDHGNSNIKEYSNKFVMTYAGSEHEALKLGQKYGYTFLRKVLNNYVFINEDLPKRSWIHSPVPVPLLEEKSVEKFEQESYLKLTYYETMATEYNISDERWAEQWSLHPNRTPTMYVHEAWMEGYTGSGVTLAIVDDGVDASHTDLVENYISSMSYNYLIGEANGSHIYPIEGHGTKTAGLAVAVKNSECIVGVSHKALFTAMKILDEVLDPTSSEVASTFTHQLDVIDIYSNSWGYSRSGSGFFSHSPTVVDALQEGVTKGRQGKGAIYVMASGNDGLYADDCNSDGNVVSMYTIAVNALTANGSQAFYGESCTSILISAFGGGIDKLGNFTEEMVTTARHGECTNQFIGTSAACPIVSGIIALTLEANPNLTWRDVQHLIVETATVDGLPESLQFAVNGANKKVSHKTGFGLINALEMINAAKTWKTVPKQIKCERNVPAADICCTGPLTATIVMEDCNIRYMEHVEVYMFFRAALREFIKIHLISPRGTDSKLLRQRLLDMSSDGVETTFMSVHHWGENPAGNWTLRMDNLYQCTNKVKIYSYTLTLYGTITDIHDGQPSDGTLGGFCDQVTTCVNGTYCRLQFNLCVYCNLTGERVVDGLCMREGDVGGYCDVNVTCILENSVCNYDNNTCLLCADNFRNIDGVCIEDGKVGGYCAIVSTPCTEDGVGCGPEFRCMLCTGVSGFHLYDNLCIEDGTLYGYCDEASLCTGEYGMACLLDSNKCQNCNYWSSYSILDGICIKDGTLGGFCNLNTKCKPAGHACDANTSRCVDCEAAEGFRELFTFCLPDGEFYGFCDTTVPCTDESVCDLELNLCVECDINVQYRNINGFCERDGIFGGYCDEDIKCIQPEAGCLRNETLNETICVYCTGSYMVQNGFCVFSSDETIDDNDAEETTEPIIVGTAAFTSAVVACAVIIFVVFKKYLEQKLSLDIRKPSPEINVNCSVERPVGIEICKESFTIKRHDTVNTCMINCTDGLSRENEEDDQISTLHSVLYTGHI